MTDLSALSTAARHYLDEYCAVLGHALKPRDWPVATWTDFLRLLMERGERTIACAFYDLLRDRYADYQALSDLEEVGNWLFGRDDFQRQIIERIVTPRHFAAYVWSWVVPLDNQQAKLLIERFATCAPTLEMWVEYIRASQSSNERALYWTAACWERTDTALCEWSYTYGILLNSYHDKQPHLREAAYVLSGICERKIQERVRANDPFARHVNS